ncbi:Crp/Fnr family transcriptional regulator [Sphingobacterium daejeonense]|uniref:Crp/Fnr family transcriptional regulator n=1 Tax=Sphingobacterium daejeonense TaxID=371142 RepID=UPI0021A58DFF|nr:Crp/Fnr family transcriptional regulator [Sphingobacterium daejeonense]MCT1532995.1 Crp/Fnr family transcriptional regulator [Sphingobacterium daejeonense]
MNINQIIDNIYPISEEAKEKIRELATEIIAPKNTIIIKADNVEKYIYFIKKGVVRAYSRHKKGDITFWFGEEGEAILSLKSYVEGKRGYENIELLENCTLYQIEINELRQLFETDINITNWGRKFAEKELLKIEHRVISRELLSAKQRYDELVKMRPGLLKRVPLKYIASYLGITQVSLSRIRKEK